MNRKFKNVKRVVALSLILFFAFSVLFISIAYADYTHEYEEYKERVISDEKMVLWGQKKHHIRRTLRRAADLMYLKDVYNLYQSEDNDNEDVKVLWSDFSARQKVYDQIRYIDAQGEEKIRINYDGGECSSVEETDLQNKSDRYYFQDTMALEDGRFIFPNWI